MSIRTNVHPAIGLLIGAIATAAIVYVLSRRSRDLLADLDIRLLVISAAIGVPVMVVLNGLELRQVAQLAGRTIATRDAVQFALFAAAANALPVPGAAVVRIGVLTRAGASLKIATLANLASMAVWASLVFMAFGASGVAQLGALAGPLLLIGVAGLGSSALLARQVTTAWTRGWLHLLVIEALIIAADVCRYAVVLAALGISPSTIHALSLSAAGLLTTIIGIVPAGLGVREAIAGFLAAGVDLDTSVAITASAADRFATLAVLGILTVPVLPRLRKLVHTLST